MLDDPPRPPAPSGQSNGLPKEALKDQSGLVGLDLQRAYPTVQSSKLKTLMLVLYIASCNSCWSINFSNVTSTISNSVVGVGWVENVFFSRFNGVEMLPLEKKTLSSLLRTTAYECSRSINSSLTSITQTFGT